MLTMLTMLLKTLSCRSLNQEAGRERHGGIYVIIMIES